MKVVIAKRTLGMKAKSQIFLLKLKILKPSSIPKGIKLKVARKALMYAAKNSIEDRGLGERAYAAPKMPADRMRFVPGPAIEILTISSPLGEPEIIMAPGAIMRKGKNTETKVNTTPQVVRRNSAHSPFL
jgi:hypothetical protein